ncbi:NUF2 [Cervus elaphus hippelaphus]|uniref:NUF2 n=1 Tax=Cervus elaphus hippelaphus TaxID=46360 RepID=A0A212CG81_CEREH|nr:NUF2 [Cervus elaphus hippelaphus]
METLSFPRYNAAEIVVHIRNKILTGADGKNLSKNDLSPNPKMPVNSEVMYPHIMEGFLPVSNLFIHL